jgi:capsular exopolysaccharide synthesis family protein
LVEKTNLLEEFTSKHPRVLAIEKNIKKIKNSIKKIAKGIKEQHLSAKRKYEAELKKEKEILKKYPQIEKYLVRHKRLFEVNDNIYNYLLKKQSELNVEKVSNLTNKRVIDYAKIPKKPLNKKLPFILIATLLLGVISALIHSIVRTHLDTKIKSSQDVEKISDIPIYGIVPYIEDKNRYNSLFVLSDQDSGATEAFRAIRANLSYISNPNSAKVILISSSVPNEGKTIVAANLATIIGMSEKRTILLSLDLRRPELHQKFSLPNDKGMSDILSGKIDYKKALWEHSRFKNLHIITSGPIPPNPAELIESNRMRKLLEELKKEYDYIIIDTPPINYVSDATSLFKYSDLNLFVLKSEFSDSRYLKELDSLLKKLNIKHNGIILNSVKSKYTVKKYFDERYVAHKEGL